MEQHEIRLLEQERNACKFWRLMAISMVRAIYDENCNADFVTDKIIEMLEREGCSDAAEWCYNLKNNINGIVGM